MPPKSYSASIRLPKTAFPMRANALARDKLWRPRAGASLYRWQRAQDRPREFVLHDGPPYANGHLHCGHALNKITKDIILRSRLLQNFKINYVPGFDTHGLPLELKALESIKRSADELSPLEIRKAARAAAREGISLQTEEFGLLGTMADFSQPYRTFDWEFEKRQLEVFREMCAKGLILHHEKPTLYSPSSRTALAEAEVEYNENHVSHSIYALFPVVELGDLTKIVDEASSEDGGKVASPLPNAASPRPARRSVFLSIWTTTPWTLPANMAVAVSKDITYALVRDEASQNLIVVAESLAGTLADLAQTTLTTLATFSGNKLLKTAYTSPLAARPTPLPVIYGSYVTDSSGTGLVHTAPAHGIDDWHAYRAGTDGDVRVSAGNAAENAPRRLISAIDTAGRYSPEIAPVIDASLAQQLVGTDALVENDATIADFLASRGCLLKVQRITHKYPYDWRTKKPVVYRASPQWFANLAPIKKRAIESLESVECVPAHGRSSLASYVEGRSEWCISRQRAWGVPIPVVYSYRLDAQGNKSSLTPHLTPSSIAHIVSVLDANGGSDYWWTASPEEFVEPEMRRSNPDLLWLTGRDTMDVWFDSGSSWTLLDHTPADVYLEGTDQYRGWFQSSLLTSIAVQDVAPYRTLITHAMVLDGAGKKMSKSLGNIISPLEIILGGKNLKTDPAYGTDLLRAWVSSVDYTRDVSLSKDGLKRTFDGLFKIRNSIKFMLGVSGGDGALGGGEELTDASITYADLGPMDQYILHEFQTLEVDCRRHYTDFNFSAVWNAITVFTNTKLALYLDFIKDCLYCDDVASPKRQKIVHTFMLFLERYLLTVAPITPLLAEEAFHFAQGNLKDPTEEDVSSSIFKKVWAEPVSSWNNPELASIINSHVMPSRDAVLSLLEKCRKDGLIKNSLETEVVIKQPSSILESYVNILKSLYGVSEVTLSQIEPKDDEVLASLFLEDKATLYVVRSKNDKCPRCWHYSKPTESELCTRCEKVTK